MTDEIRSWLIDIQNAILEIQTFLPENSTFDAFKQDLKTKRAIERNIEIIGEAVHRILKVDSEIKISFSRKIVDTRNRIIHGYDTVSDEIIWGIVMKSLPTLLKEVNILLQDEEE
jgi:uncharacterized protein with HEPN domain